MYAHFGPDSGQSVGICLSAFLFKKTVMPYGH